VVRLGRLWLFQLEVLYTLFSWLPVSGDGKQNALWKAPSENPTKKKGERLVKGGL
jgi:hypothetical protein